MPSSVRSPPPLPALPATKPHADDAPVYLGQVMRLASIFPVAVCCWALTAWGCGSSSNHPGFEQLGNGGHGAQTGVGGDAISSGGNAAGGAMGKGGYGAAGGSPAALGAPYPVVLAHGFFGFEGFAGVDFLGYHFQVKDHLADHGEPWVFTPAVDPFNSSAYRGEQLYQAILTILAQTGHAKVNIIGHSQGGLDARVVAHNHPEVVASVVTLQTPHTGSPIADIALKAIDSPYLQGIVNFLLQTVGAPLYDEIGESTNLAASLYDFSSEGSALFNATYTDTPGIYYASVAGRSDWHFGGSICQVSSAPDFIKAYNNNLDPIDPLFDLPEQLLDGGITDPYPNDGLVRVVDARWGDFLGCVPADHMDMIGQLFGDNPGFGNPWDHRQFYQDLVSLLRDKGF